MLGVENSVIPVVVRKEVGVSFGQSCTEDSVEEEEKRIFHYALESYLYRWR